MVISNQLKLITMAQKLLYITERRFDLFKEEADPDTEWIFHFPKDEMELIKKRPIYLFDFAYAHDGADDEREFKIQDKIFGDKEFEVFVILIGKKDLPNIERFIDSEVIGNNELDIIYIDFIEIEDQEKENLFIFSLAGALSELYKKNMDYFARKELAAQNSLN
jgi:hypothetical protein